jgi:WD40 repeat protein
VDGELVGLGPRGILSFDEAKGALQTILETGGDRATLSPDGRRIARATASGIELLDTKGGAPGERLASELKDPTVLRWVHDHAIALSTDDAAEIWDTGTKTRTHHCEGCSLLSVSPDAKVLVVGRPSDVVVVSFLRKGRPDFRLRPPESSSGASIGRVTWSPDARYFAVFALMHLASAVDNPGAVRLFDARTYAEVALPKPSMPYSLSMFDFDPTSRRLVLFDSPTWHQPRPARLLVYDLRPVALRAALEAEVEGLFAWRPDGEAIAQATGPVIRVRNLNSGENVVAIAQACGD